MSRWTKSSRNSVRSSVLRDVAVVECLPLLVALVACLPLLEVMEVQRLPLLRLLLTKNVPRLTLISPSRNVRLPKKSRELLRPLKTASMPRRRGQMKRARRPTLIRQRLRLTKMLPLLRRSNRRLMPS